MRRVKGTKNFFRGGGEVEGVGVVCMVWEGWCSVSVRGTWTDLLPCVISPSIISILRRRFLPLSTAILHELSIDRSSRDYLR